MGGTDAPSELAVVVQPRPRVGVCHSVQSQGSGDGRRGGVDQGQRSAFLAIFAVLQVPKQKAVFFSQNWENTSEVKRATRLLRTCLSVSLAGE